MKSSTFLVASVFLALAFAPPFDELAGYAQPVELADGTESESGVTPPEIGRVFAWYQLGGTRRNTTTGVAPFISYPDGPNPLTIPSELSSQGLSRYLKFAVHESVEFVQPDAVLLHNPFGAPSLLPMAFDQRDMARDQGYLALANGSDVQKAVRELRKVAGTDEVWFYLGTPDAVEFDELTFNEFLYSVQPLINEDVSIVIDSSADEGVDSYAWKYARSLEPWVDVGYEPRPLAGGPWKSTDMTCFASVLHTAIAATGTDGPTTVPHITGGFFSSDPDLRPHAAAHMARTADINGEIVLLIPGGGETGVALAINLMSQGFSVAISGWDLNRYQYTAQRMRDEAAELAAAR